MQMQSLQRLLGILKQDGKLAKAEVLSNLCDVVWEYLPKSIRCAVACANHASVFFHRMKDRRKPGFKQLPDSIYKIVMIRCGMITGQRKIIKDGFERMVLSDWASESLQKLFDSSLPMPWQAHTTACKS